MATECASAVVVCVCACMHMCLRARAGWCGKILLSIFDCDYADKRMQTAFFGLNEKDLMQTVQPTTRTTDYQFACLND